MKIKTLLPELKTLVMDLSDDLLGRSTENAQIDAGLREAYTQIEKGGRTAQAFEVWREDYLDQVAVAWVLGCVFVRFMEDNRLIDECWLAGEGERRNLAESNHELYFREHPHDSDREYFEHVFREVGKIPACRDLFAEGKTPLWVVGPSGDAAMRLLAFWREIEPETGKLRRIFNHELHESHELNPESSDIRAIRIIRGCLTDSDPTRFLGDLYQGLSERARKKYALLQTPVFVEELILDRTLDPAIEEFGLDEVRMIDPTCGSGHFLLGAFARLFDLWIKREDNEVVAAQKALDGVWGVDINPFAVAIARFRLIVAALRVCGIKRLNDAPAWNLHLATGDSLLFGSRWTRGGTKIAEQQFLGTEEESWAPEIYACEDKAALQEVLGQQYHAVVGNPPYIIVRDRSLNAAYRERYSTCHQKYSLAVPFIERFFDLCWNGKNGQTGYVGKITANSFMKREFGKKLIEQFFPKIDLTHVVDTSGAYIPGHGTPTVILFGRNRKPVSDTVRAVMGIKGESSTPADPSQGLVWQSILKQIDVANVEGEFTSTTDVPRSTFNSHPWSIGGGGASELKERLEKLATDVLGKFADSIGITSVTGEDDLYLFPHSQDVLRLRVTNTKKLVLGDMIRDYVIAAPVCALWPYNRRFELLSETDISDLIQILWPYKANISLRRRFGTPMLLKGAKWYEWQELYHKKLRTLLSIAFAEVATHNHFVLDRGGKVFKQTAPIIKLPAEATEDDHFELLGLLNSSTACFWLKQSCHNKGSTVDQHGARQRTDPFEDFYQYNGTRLAQFPVSSQRPGELARELDRLGQEYASLLPDQLVERATPTATALEEAKAKAAAIRGRMIALQEEQDCQCYELYGLLNHESHELHEWLDIEDRIRVIRAIRGCSLGQRAFEIVMARKMASGDLQTTWFDRHGSTPITELPSHWPDEYRAIVQHRIELIQACKEIRLIEKPEYKRRWNDESWDQQQQRALRNWLLDRLESYWKDEGGRQQKDEGGRMKAEEDNIQPSAFSLPPFTLQSVAQLSDKASGDQDFLQVAAIYRGREDFDVAALVAELVESESVPFLPCLRYKPAGLRKRAVWEKTWELQREEDQRKDEGGRMKDEKKENNIQPSSFILQPSEIPVPPKYTSADFQKSDYWRLRGKLDVPKERWISFPHCETESDPSLVVGWAGWDHLQQATALIAYYDARKREGWGAKRLTPLLAGLDQLLPWIHQWHPEVDPEFGETAGQSFETMLEADAHELGLTLEDIRAWEPPKKTRRARKKRKSPAEGAK